MPTTTQRGYGVTHQRERDRWRPVVERGEGWCAELVCLMPTRWIIPGSRWDLAHDRRTGGYLGPAHAICNRAEGGRFASKRRARRRRRWAL
ncbi:MAG: hypothetical protein ACRDQG_17835 [Pseudonocardiaceae bacterium]